MQTDKSIFIPTFLVDEYKQILGDQYSQFVASLSQDPIRAGNPNPDKGWSIDSDSVSWHPDAKYLPKGFRPSQDPDWSQGKYYVQEPSSLALSSYLFDFKEPILALDLCAAPGGTTTQLLAGLPSSSIVIGNEVVSKRNRILSQNLSMWGNHNTFITQNHPTTFAQFQDTFDLVVVDAPCSGEGLCRKDNYVFNTISERTIWGNQRRQLTILQPLVEIVKSGGMLIYSTCTWNRKENEDVIAEFIDTNPDFEIVTNNILSQNGWVELVQGQYRAFPHRINGEGLFICALRKKGELVGKLKPFKKLKSLPHYYKPLSKTEMNKLLEILPVEVTNDDDSFIFVKNQDGYKVFPKTSLPYLEMFADRLNIHDFGLLGKFELKGI
jgi:16S rRNA C967 or C1407 C5-methylase (RsmB/RsmF family)